MLRECQVIGNLQGLCGEDRIWSSFEFHKIDKWLAHVKCDLTNHEYYGPSDF